MKKILAALTLFFTASFASAESDLVLPGELWFAEFSKYVCQALGEPVSRPEPFESMNVVFERITTDKTLDNVLFKATYEEDGSICRYSAITFANNALETMILVDSKAYAVTGNSTCEVGKKSLDDILEYTEYLYGGKNVAVMVSAPNSKDICGGDAIGVNFAIKGMLQP